MDILMGLEITSKTISEMTINQLLQIEQTIYQHNKYMRGMIVLFPESKIFNCKMN